MNSNLQRIRHRPLCLSLAFFVITGSVYAYQLTVGEATVLPGEVVQVPVTLDTAADVAVIQFQINYDPQLLTLVDVTNALDTLGSAYTLQYEDNDGVIGVILYREAGLLSGSGTIAALEFYVNPGSELNMGSAVVLAEVGLGNQDGKNLAWDSPVEAVSGRVRVSVAVADSDGDGIPDAWEESYFGGVTNASPDLMCANGLNTIWEAYVAGLDPNSAQSRFCASFRSDRVFEWNTVSGRVYSIYWTTNLLSGFQCLESNVSWTRGGFTNQFDLPSGYYKVEVQLEP